MDDPDARLEAAEPVPGPLPQAGARRKPPDPRAPYHQPLDPDHEDDLLLAIGQGLALIGASERQKPAAIVQAIDRYADAVRAGEQRLTRDPSDALLALACVFGQQLCREFGFGWGHVRRVRAPGIVLISRDCRHAVRPRQLIERALRDGGGVLTDFFQRLGRAPARPRSGGFYAPLS